MRLKNLSLSFSTQVFKSFSEEPRVRILNLLFNKEELCISDLEQVLEFTQTKTSRHLIYLKNAGIVGNRKIDQWVFYFIKDEVMDLVSRILDFLQKDQVLENDLETYDTLFSNRELSINRIKSSKLKKAE